MSNSLIGEYLDLTKKNKDPNAVMQQSKIKIVSVDSTHGITADGTRIEIFDLFDDQKYIKNDFSALDLGAGNQYKTTNTQNTVPLSQPLQPADEIYAPQQPNQPIVQKNSPGIIYNDNQKFIDAAIKIAKKQGKTYSHQITIDITVPFDINVITTTANALNVSQHDIVKVLLDNMDVDTESIKTSLIGKILNIPEDEIIPVAAEPEPVIIEPIIEETEIRNGTAEVTVLSEFFVDNLKMVVELSGGREEIITIDEILLQQFLTEHDSFALVIKKIKELDSEIISSDDINFEFKEELYYSMLDKVKSMESEQPEASLQPYEDDTKEEKLPEVVEIDLKEVETAKEKTANLPRIGNTLTDIWKSKK